MSLVDYASDEDESHDSEGEDSEIEKKIPEASEIGPRPNLSSQNQHVEQLVRERSQDPTLPARPSVEKLPDASLLFNSPHLSSHIFSGSNYTSRVTATTYETASRKRAANGSTSSSVQPKLPKVASSSLQPRNVSANRLLVPPQLSGRSNVVTEDISKLFVKRQASADSQPSEQG